MQENLYEAPETDIQTTDSDQDVKYAGFWIRLLATIIDSIVMLVIIFPLMFLIYGEAYFSVALDESSVGFFYGTADVLVNTVLPALFVILFWAYKSATPGKMLCGLKIVTVGNFQKPSMLQFIGRYFAYYLSMLVFFLGYIWAAFDKRKQAWHDKLASTAVIKAR